MRLRSARAPHTQSLLAAAALAVQVGVPSTVQQARILLPFPLLLPVVDAAESLWLVEMEAVVEAASLGKGVAQGLTDKATTEGLAAVHQATTVAVAEVAPVRQEPLAQRPLAETAAMALPRWAPHMQEVEAAAHSKAGHEEQAAPVVGATLAPQEQMNLVLTEQLTPEAGAAVPPTSQALQAQEATAVKAS